MKKAILPIIGGILFVIIFSRINPQIEAFGVFLVAGIGVLVGVGVNKLIFKLAKHQ